MKLNQIYNTRTKQFILLNILGWFAYFINTMIGPMYWDKPSAYYWMAFYSSILGFGLSFFLRPIYKRFWGDSAKKLVFVVIITCVLVSSIWAVFYNLLYLEVHSNSSYKPDGFLDYLLATTKILYIYFCWSFLYIGIKFYRAMQNSTQRELSAVALAHQAQLKMLRYQLNPHFLFNTLNAISTLILKKDNETANEMVARLSNFLRYSLDNDPLQKVTLDQEITTLKLYLCIEKVRFEDRLLLDFQVDEEASKALIPSLILQPLVENSIKYAVARSETTGKISINAKVFANELLVELKDDGPGVELVNGDLPKGRGVGIANTKQRLQELYEDKHSFTISNIKPTGLQVNIRLPYEVEQNA
jgi:sensor histidine kinase YesM